MMDQLNLCFLTLVILLIDILDLLTRKNFNRRKSFLSPSLKDEETKSLSIDRRSSFNVGISSASKFQLNMKDEKSKRRSSNKSENLNISFVSSDIYSDDRQNSDKSPSKHLILHPNGNKENFLGKSFKRVQDSKLLKQTKTKVRFYQLLFVLQRTEDKFKQLCVPSQKYLEKFSGKKMHKPTQNEVLQKSNYILFKKLGRNEKLPKVMRTSPPKKNRILSSGLSKKTRKVLSRQSKGERIGNLPLSPISQNRRSDLGSSSRLKTNPYTTR